MNQAEEQVTCPDFVNDYNENPVVLFDLETSGFDKNCDILQIAAKYGNQKFNVYVKPTKEISANATAANGLINCQGDLMYYGVKVDSVPMILALVYLLEWLNSIGKKCYLAAHNLSFDGPRLFRMISEYSLIDDYSEIVCGFIDTLEVIRKTTGKRGRGDCSISGLSNMLKISSVEAHNAIYDCDILSKILYKLDITGAILIKTAHSFQEKVQYWRNGAEASQNLSTLLPLQSIVGVEIRKKLALVGFTMEILLTIYNQCGKNGLHQQIQDKLKKKGVGIRSSSITKIADWFSKENL